MSYETSLPFTPLFLTIYASECSWRHIAVGMLSNKERVSKGSIKWAQTEEILEEIQRYRRRKNSSTLQNKTKNAGFAKQKKIAGLAKHNKKKKKKKRKRNMSRS